MKLSHINSLVLYSKNWYRHSDDVIADWKLHVAIDHPDINVKDMSLEELYGLMRNDYIEWADSIDENDFTTISYKTDLRKRVDDCVAWEDDPMMKKMWHWMNIYSIYIPDLFSGLKPPVYDRKSGLFPQRRVSWFDPFEGLPRDASDESLNAAADRYFSQSRTAVMEHHFRSALKDIQIDLIVDMLCEYNLKYQHNKRKTKRYVIDIYEKLWNKAKKSIPETLSGNNSKTFERDMFSIRINPARMDVDLMFIPIRVSADVSELDDYPSETSLKDTRKMLFDKCISKIDKKFFAKIIFLEDKEEILGEGKDEREIMEKRIDGCAQLFNDETRTGTWGTGGFFVNFSQENALTVSYWAVIGFGPHNNQLYNDDRWATGSKY